MDPQCASYKNLQIKNDRVLAINPSSVFCQEILVAKCSFSVKIIKLSKCIAVGIADASLKGELMFTKNSFVILDNTGVCKISDENKNTDKGFNQGDKVVVNVDLTEGSIEWQVRGSQLFKLENVRLLQNK